MRLLQLRLFLLFVLQASWSLPVLAAYNFSTERIRELQEEVQLLEAKRSPENEKHIVSKRAQIQLAVALEAAVIAAPCDDQDLVNISPSSDPAAMWAEAGTDAVLEAFLQYWITNEPPDTELTVMIARIYDVTDYLEFQCSAYDAANLNACSGYDLSTKCDDTYGYSKNQLLTSFRNFNTFLGDTFTTLQDVRSSADSIQYALSQTFVQYNAVKTGILKIFEEILGIALMVVGAVTFFFGGAALDAVGAATIGAEVGATTTVEDAAAIVGTTAEKDASALSGEVNAATEDHLPTYAEAMGEKPAAAAAAEAKADSGAVLANSINKVKYRYGDYIQGTALATQGQMVIAQSQAILQTGKNLDNTITNVLTEAQDYTMWANATLIGWSLMIEGNLQSTFMGSMPNDTIDANGRSDFSSLHNVIAEGSWLNSMTSANTMNIALEVFLKFAIPTLLLQNSKVRPTLVIRPYACTDSDTAKTDTEWTSLFGGYSTKENSQWIQSSTTLSDYPGLCFFLVDANQDQAGIPGCVSTRAGCLGDTAKRISELTGMVNKVFNGTTSWLSGLQLESWVQSLYEGWVNNGRQNGVPQYTFGELAESSDPKYIFNNALNQPGMFNSFFAVCGTDNITVLTSSKSYKRGSSKYSPDMELIFSNSIAAGRDWATRANYTSGYPCNPEWASTSEKLKRRSAFYWPERIVRRHLLGQETDYWDFDEGDEP